MNAKKQKAKARRRAKKLVDQAWDAADEDNLDLAFKLIRRAIETHNGNPTFWYDQGRLQCLDGEDAKAVESFQAALSLAPDFADAYAQLASIRVRQGMLAEAVTLQNQASKYAPNSDDYRRKLDAYRSLAGAKDDVELSTTGNAHLAPSAIDRVDSDLQRRVDGLDWISIEHQLTNEGWALIPKLVDSETCADLRRSFDDESLFAKTVVMNKERFGHGVYKYFRAPIPGVIDELRQVVFPYVSQIANVWQRMLDSPESYPSHWHDFRQRCAELGQTTPTPLLLKYGPGGFNAPHRDIRGTVFFPIQMAVVLSSRVDPANAKEDGFAGGDFLFCDVPERKPADRRKIPAGLGDAVLFCTRDRLDTVADTYGLKPVKHGVDRITAGIRYVLGVPFHEYE